MDIKQTLKDIEATRDLYVKARLTAERTIKDFAQDKSVDLDIRWKVFIESDLGDEEAYIVHFECFNNGKWKQWCRNKLEDDLLEYQDRGAELEMKIWAEEILPEYIGRQFELDGQTYETRDNKRTVEFTQEDFDAWREEVLAKFLKSFRYDW